MNASDLFRSGKLQEAIDAQGKAVKADPMNPEQRLFLFDLLAFAGDLERARLQIEAVNYGEVMHDLAVHMYRQLLDAEEWRRRVFRDGVPPLFLAEPPEHVRLRLETVQYWHDNQHEKARHTIQKAAACSRAVAGELNGKPFTALRDADDLFGPVLEVMEPNKYSWVPLEQIKSLTVKELRYRRDLIWLPVYLEVVNGPHADVFLPVLYPGSHEADDDQVKLGRVTRFVGPDEGPVRGLGAHDFDVDGNPICLVEWRQLTIQQPNRAELGSAPA
jgi:type VI secretion system protein ImpE